MEHPHANIAMRGQFRINAKQLFATWPRTNVHLEDLHEWLILKLSPSHLITSRELHQDGESHYHAYIEFRNRKDIRDARLLDYEGRHANIGPVRNKQAAIQYAKKDGTFLEWFNEGINNEFNPYTIASTMELPEYFETCRKMKVSYQYALQAWNYTLQRANDINTITGEQPIEGSIHAPYLRLLIPETSRTNWIKGPSGIGKTTWALTVVPKPALFVRHLDTLKQFRCGYHVALIFDDMSFQHLPRTNQIMIVDTDHPQQIHVRYGVVNLPAKLTKIFLSNDDIFTEDPAIMRRIKKFFI